MALSSADEISASGSLLYRLMGPNACFTSSRVSERLQRQCIRGAVAPGVILAEPMVVRQEHAF
jgi:hypothetical protein